MYPLRNVNLNFGTRVAGVPLIYSIMFILFMFLIRSITMSSVGCNPWGGISISNVLSISSLYNIKCYGIPMSTWIILTTRLTKVSASLISYVGLLIY